MSEIASRVILMVDACCLPVHRTSRQRYRRPMAQACARTVAVWSAPLRGGVGSDGMVRGVQNDLWHVCTSVLGVLVGGSGPLCWGPVDANMRVSASNVSAGIALRTGLEWPSMDRPVALVSTTSVAVVGASGDAADSPAI